MKKYVVTIEEVVSQDFEVWAEEGEDPLKIAEEKYWTGEFILSPGEVQHRQMAVHSPDSEAAEWVEF